ncbi:MAG: PilZ domain-containing protein [Phycisphaerae bacterium]
MFDEIESSLGGSFSADEAFNVFQELEQNRSEEIRKQRCRFRAAVKSAVTLEAGNSSARRSFKAKGVTGDISESGLGALFPVPIAVGDIYRLQFDQSELALPLTFARCVRCRLIREDAFECGFLFFAPIGLPENLGAHEKRVKCEV